MNRLAHPLLFFFIVFSFDVVLASTREESFLKVAQEFAKKLEQQEDAMKEIAVEVSKVKNGKTKVETAQELEHAINKLLSIAPNTAHIISEDDQVFWLLQAIYSKNEEDSYLNHIGVWFERRGTKWHVSEVLGGSPAFKAGVQRGDEIVSVNGKPFEPVHSFKNLPVAEKAKIQVKRTPWDKPFDIEVNTVYESLEQSMYSATKLSVETKIMNKKNVGYFRLWGGTKNDQNSLLTYVTNKFQSSSDAMILDLRGGIGVLPPGLEKFFLPSKGLTSEPSGQSQTYSKPLIVLINRFTADDKKELASVLQSHNRATLIGEPPMHVPLKGVIFELEPGKRLIFIPDHSNDGTLKPDKRIKDTLVYTGGQDRILLEALQVATEQ